jgi:hypothetical protein
MNDECGQVRGTRCGGQGERVPRGYQKDAKLAEEIGVDWKRTWLST